MSKYVAYSNLPRRWDFAWQMWGLSTRIMQAMGLHRDGQRWHMDDAEVDLRRRVFWEIYTTDIMISKNWDRPYVFSLKSPVLSGSNAIAGDQFDTQIPVSWVYPEPIYQSERAKLACLAKEYAHASVHSSLSRSFRRVIDECLRVQPSSYSSRVEIWRKL